MQGRRPHHSKGAIMTRSRCMRVSAATVLFSSRGVDRPLPSKGKAFFINAGWHAVNAVMPRSPRDLPCLLVSGLRSSPGGLRSHTRNTPNTEPCPARPAVPSCPPPNLSCHRVLARRRVLLPAPLRSPRLSTHRHLMCRTRTRARRRR